MAKARKSRASTETPLRVSRGTLARVTGGRVIANHRPTQEAQLRLELLMAAVNLPRFDPELTLPKDIPDTFEKLYDRALEQFIELYKEESKFQIPAVVGPQARRRAVWIRGDLMLRLEAIAREYPCPLSRIVDYAVTTYVDYHTRHIDKRLITTLAATGLKIIEASEASAESLRERERKSRKLLRTGKA
jgi:hypothetical protein